MLSNGTNTVRYVATTGLRLFCSSRSSALPAMAPADGAYRTAAPPISEAGIQTGVGSLRESYDVFAETFEPIEHATPRSVDSFNNLRLLELIGNISPTDADPNFSATLKSDHSAATETGLL